jgi:hypothetical protein
LLPDDSLEVHFLLRLTALVHHIELDLPSAAESLHGLMHKAVELLAELLLHPVEVPEAEHLHLDIFYRKY